MIAACKEKERRISDMGVATDDPASFLKGGHATRSGLGSAPPEGTVGKSGTATADATVNRKRGAQFTQAAGVLTMSEENIEERTPAVPAPNDVNEANEISRFHL